MPDDINTTGEMGRADGRTTRRRWLVGSLAVALPLVAGCTSDGDGTGDNPAESPAGDEGPSNTDTVGETDQPTGTPDGSAAASFGEAVQFADSYVMEGTWEQGGETLTLEARFDGGNAYWRFDQGGQVIESYYVDGDQYLVTNDSCLLNPGRDTAPDGLGPNDFESDAESQADLEATGQTTIDGEPVLVYELSASGEGGFDTAATYYVHANTGYLRRVETDGSVLDFHSWGEAEPVTAPNLDCQSVNQ
jgi:hypothetical protein